MSVCVGGLLVMLRHCIRMGQAGLCRACPLASIGHVIVRYERVTRLSGWFKGWWAYCSHINGRFPPTPPFLPSFR